MQENVQTSLQSLHVDWPVWVKTDWARRGGRKRRQKKATKHHKCGTPIMNLLISYFGVAILKFGRQHLDTQGLSAEPSMKNRINSNSTAWYWKVRVQEDFQKMAHVYLMSSAFLLIPFWQIFWFHLTLDRDGSVGQWWQFADEWFPVPHFLLTSACQQFDFHEEFKSSNCVKQFCHTGSWNRITVLATTIWTSCFKGWLWIVRWGSICCTVEYALLVTKWLPYKESAL